jgi:hypothetical protein
MGRSPPKPSLFHAPGLLDLVDLDEGDAGGLVRAGDLAGAGVPAGRVIRSEESWLPVMKGKGPEIAAMAAALGSAPSCHCSPPPCPAVDRSGHHDGSAGRVETAENR